MFFTNPTKSSAWRVPSARLEDLLDTSKQSLTLSTGQVVQTSDLKYTIIDHEDVVFRNVHELAELARATRLPNLMDLVSFQPKRIILQQTIASIIARVQLTPLGPEEESSLDHGAVLQRISKIVHDPIVSNQETLTEIESLHKQREEIQNIVSELVLGQVRSSTNAELIEQCAKALSTAREHIRNEHFGDHVHDYTKDRALIALATDKVYNQCANKRINILVNRHIDELASNGKVRLLDIPPSTSRKSLMVVGGQASGKGVACGYMKSFAEQSGIAWSNISKGGTDNIAKFLEHEAAIPEIAQQLTANEAGYVQWTLTMSALNQRVREGTAPHSYSELIALSRPALESALSQGGSAEIIVVSTKVEDAVERAYQRGVETGRYLPAQVLLRAHKISTKTLPFSLAEVGGENVNLLFLDNNVPKANQPVEIAKINCLTREIIIIDEKKFNDYIKKVTINENALRLEDLYDEQAAVTLQEYFAPCLEKGYTMNAVAPSFTLGA